MATAVRTRSRGIYTTILSSGTQQQPCVSFETNPNNPYPSQSPLQSNQVAQTSDPEIHQADLLFHGMTADEQDIGFYKVFSNINPEIFVALKQQLKQRGLSYIYRAPKNELVAMIPSHLHEHALQALAEYLRSIMSEQRVRNPELGEYWTLHNNKGASFEQALDGSTTYQPDLGIYNNNDGQLLTEITFTQRWEDLLKRVEHIVEGEECWGVLVVKIDEVDKWEKPTRPMDKDDFVFKAEWLAQAKASRDDDPYGPVCVKGIEWTKTVNVQVCFFDHAWKRGDELPTMHQLNASGDIDFHDLDDELATVWRRMVEHVGNMYDINVQPVPIAIPWKDLRKGIIAGLVLTGQARYARWGGSRYKKRCRTEKGGLKTSGPSKFKKARTV